MSIDRLNSAAWAAGFAMAPTEDEALDAIAPEMRAASEATQTSRAVAVVTSGATETSSEKLSLAAVRQWIAGLQRRATA